MGSYQILSTEQNEALPSRHHTSLPDYQKSVNANSSNEDTKIVEYKDPPSNALKQIS